MKKLFSLLLALMMICSVVFIDGMVTTLSADNSAASSASAVAEFKATSGDGKVTLSWKAVSGEPSYEIQWKRSSASAWKKAGTTKKTTATVKGLSNGVNYDFKIVVGGKESAVLQISPSAAETTTVSASDVSPSEGTIESTMESAADAVAKMGVGWNLGNSLDSWGSWIGEDKPVKKYETAWGNPQTTQALMDAVASEGFGAVRVPITWRQHIKAGGKIDKDWLDRVQEVVDYVLNAGMYCIINVHHDTGTEGWIIASESGYDAAVGRFVKIWEQVADRFKDYGDKLIFECMNETLNQAREWNTSDSSAFSVIKNYQQDFVDTVRASGGNNAERNLVVSTYAASSNTNIVNSFTLPTDTVKGHMIMEVHNYDPQGFTWKDVSYATDRSTWGTSQDKTDMENFLKRIANRAEELGVPVIVGEFSSDDKNNEEERAKHAAYMVSTGKKYGIVCFWWDNGSEKGCKIFDRSTGKVTMPKIVEALVDSAK